MGYSYNADQAHQQWLDWAKQKTEDKQAAEAAKMAELSKQAQNSAAMEAAAKNMDNPYFAAEFGRVMQSSNDPKLALSMGLRSAAQTGIQRSDTLFNERVPENKKFMIQDETSRLNARVPIDVANIQDKGHRYLADLQYGPGGYSDRQAKAKADAESRLKPGQLSSAYGDAYKEALGYYKLIAEQNGGMIPHPDGKVGKDGKLIMIPLSDAGDLINWRANENFQNRIKAATGGLSGMNFGTAAGVNDNFGANSGNIMNRSAVSAGERSNYQYGSNNNNSTERGIPSQTMSITAPQSLSQMQLTPGQEYQQYGKYEGISVPGNDSVYRFNRNGSPFFTNQLAIDHGPGVIPVNNVPVQPDTLASQATNTSSLVSPQAPSIDTVSSRVYQNVQPNNLPQMSTVNDQQVSTAVPAFRGGKTDLEKLYDKFIALHKTNPMNEADTTPSTGAGAGLPITLSEIPQQPVKKKNKFGLKDFSWMSDKPTGLNQYDVYRYFNRQTR